MLPLFDEPPSFRREALAAKLKELARQQIFIGTSSWKYEGWCGQIYNPERYRTRGSRFSRKRFEAECLSEYAETFPIVCGDFSFYQFPTEQFWNRLFHSAGADLQFALKVPEEITVREFPGHPRYGPRAGAGSPSFLNADLLRGGFLDVLAPHQRQVAVLIFEFGTLPKRAYENVTQFVQDLDPFLAKLPRGFQYSVEVRNREFLTDPYFDCLQKHGVAHVFNSWTRMPGLERQIEIPGAWTAPCIVSRALLRPGREYDDAVGKFSPYEQVLEENPGARDALRKIIQTAREKNRRAYIFVNNRLEGNAPQTIEAILKDD